MNMRSMSRFPRLARPRTWRGRLLLAFVGFLAPVSLWEAYDLEQRFARQEAEVLEAQVQTAQALATGLEAVLNDLRHNLALVAHQLERERPTGRAVAAVLTSLRPLAFPADVLILLDADGVAVAAEPDEGRVGRTAGDRPYQRAVLRGESAWALSPLLVGSHTGRLGVAMIHRVRGPSGEPAGAILGWLDAVTVGRALGHAVLPPDTVFAVIDDRGRAVYHSKYPDLRLTSRDWSGSPDVREALAGRVARVPKLRSTSDGEVRMGATVPVPSVGWAVGIFRSREAALAPVFATVRRQIAELALLVLVLAGAAWLLATRIAQPVRALQAGAEALGAGRLDVRVPEDTPDELGQLGRAFNAMAERLGRHMADLSATKATLEAVLGSVPEGILLVEASGRIALANPAARAILGREPTAADLPAERALSGETFTAAEVRVETAPGERILRVAGAPIFDAAGRIDGAAVAFEDITERTRAEAERADLLRRERAARTAAEAAERRAAFLAEASALLASSLEYESTLASIARLAVPVLADWCVVDVLDADRGITRLARVHTDPSRLELAKTFDGLYPIRPDDPSGPAAVIRTGRSEFVPEIEDALLETTVPDAEKLRFVRQFELCSYLCVPLVARNRIFGALTLIMAESGRRHAPPDLAFAEDVARRVALFVDNARLFREAQAAAGEARDAVRARDVFLARASHELRTPLTSALGTVRLLGRAMAGTLGERSEPLLDIATRNLTTMAALINDLLDASKLAAGEERLDRQPIPLAALVGASVEIVAAQARDRGIGIQRVVPEGLTMVVDRLKLEQVLVNLLANAVKFTPPGGEIAVDAQAVPQAVVVRVRDTGEGILPEDLERIFEPFVQTGPRGVRRPRGTGLGLAICRQIVSLHGGTIHAESEGPGRGSTFVVRIPVPAAEHQAA